MRRSAAGPQISESDLTSVPSSGALDSTGQRAVWRELLFLQLRREAWMLCSEGYLLWGHDDWPLLRACGRLRGPVGAGCRSF